MTNKYKSALAAIALTLALGACGGSSDSEPTATVTETETYDSYSYSEPEPEPIDEDTDIDEDVAMAALEITWDDMTETEKTDLCYEWNLMPETSLDVFMETAGEDFADRQQVKDFFDGKCVDY